MSVELAGEKGLLGPFASNAGYTALLEASQSDPTLKKFFHNANAEGKDIDVVRTALDQMAESSDDEDVATCAKELSKLMKDQEVVFITNGTHEAEDKDKEKWDEPGQYGDNPSEPLDKPDAADENEPDDSYDVEKSDFEIDGNFVKVDNDLHMVFGWFSIVAIKGQAVVDTQNDVIAPNVIEASAYDYVLNARRGGEMHETHPDGSVKVRGRLIESCVFTAEKQSVMLQSLHDQGIRDAVLDLKCDAWWGGFKIDDMETWGDVKSGRLRAFSIGGRGKRDSC